MDYDQTWMGYGWIGGLQAGAISAAAGLLLYLAIHLLGRRQGWSDVRQAGLAWGATLLLTARMDLWNLFYFNYGRLQSLQLLKARLDAVHDPDGIGIRVLCELLGAGIGVGIGWWLAGRRWWR